jgi:hypothetical protein
MDSPPIIQAGINVFLTFPDHPSTYRYFKTTVIHKTCRLLKLFLYHFSWYTVYRAAPTGWSRLDGILNLYFSAF